MKYDRILAAVLLVAAAFLFVVLFTAPVGTSLVLCAALGFYAGLFLATGSYLAWMTRS